MYNLLIITLDFFFWGETGKMLLQCDGMAEELLPFLPKNRETLELV